MDRNRLARNFYVLPCCVLLLNLVLGVLSYKMQRVRDPYLRTGAIIAMTLFGGSVVGWLMMPVFNLTVLGLHRTTRRRSGWVGEILFLLALGVVVFWLYFRMYVLGPQAVLPPEWRNPRG